VGSFKLLPRVFLYRMVVPCSALLLPAAAAAAAAAAAVAAGETAAGIAPAGRASPTLMPLMGVISMVCEGRCYVKNVPRNYAPVVRRQHLWRARRCTHSISLLLSEDIYDEGQAAHAAAAHRWSPQLFPCLTLLMAASMGRQRRRRSIHRSQHELGAAAAAAASESKAKAP